MQKKYRTSIFRKIGIWVGRQTFNCCNEHLEVRWRNDPLEPVARGAYMFSLGLLGNMELVEEEYKHCKEIFEDQRQQIYADFSLSKLRLGVRGDLSKNEMHEFKEIARKTGLVDYWNQFGWPDLCRPVGGNDFECN